MIAILAALVLAPAPEWVSLFDGKTLSGWRVINGSADFKAENGQLVGRTVPGSPNSFLCTQRTYADFELELEAWLAPEANSGVQIRSNSVPGYQSGRVHGYQIELDPTERAWTGGLYDEARRGWLQDLSQNEKARKAYRPGRWNKIRVVAQGDRIQSWVNGVAAADFRDRMTRSGFIGLQVHQNEKAGIEAKWRNLRIRDLGDPQASPPPGGRWLLRTEADVSRWVTEGNSGTPARWKWIEGALETVPGTGNLVTREGFSSADVHVEFMVDDNGKAGQENGNSGVYLMQSYEVQILNSAPRGPLNNECGGIYGIKAPDFAMAMPAGVWQSYDIEFTAPRWDGDRKTANARITVYHNGTLVHDHVELPRSTGAGMAESPSPRPLRLQEHGNHIRFRNVWIRPRS